MRMKCKSLRETLLEYAVINFDAIFDFCYKRRCQNQKITKIVLPPGLFERIIFKFKELNWRPYYLISMLSYRDILNWRNIDIKWRSISNLGFQAMNEVKYPLTHLAIHLQALDEIGMTNLCCLGSTIESLDLQYINRRCEEFLCSPFPRLKKLYLTNAHSKIYSKQPLSLDLQRFSDTLEEFSIKNECLDKSSIKSVASLKQLKILSCQYARSTCEKHVFLEALESMDQLRTLDLRGSISEKIQSKLLAVLSKLPNLENFDMSHNSEIGEDWILECMRCKKWKKFGMIDCCDVGNTYSPYHRFKPWANQVFLNAFHRFTSSRLMLRYLEAGRYTHNFIMKVINVLSLRPHTPMRKVTEGSSKRRMADIVMNKHVARVLLETVVKKLNNDFCILLQWSLLCHFVEDDRKYVNDKIKHLLSDGFSHEQLTDDNVKVYVREILLKINKIET